MPIFEYSALDSQGKVIKGILETESVKSLRNELRLKQLIYLKSSNSNSSGKRKSFWDIELLPAKLKLKDLASITRQIATLLDAGIPVLQTLESLRSQTKNRTHLKFISGVHFRVSEGLYLSDAIAKSPFKVDDDFVSSVKAAEETNNLGKVLLRLAESLERKFYMNQKIKSAMTYPIMLVGIAIAVLMFLMVFVVPKIATVFSDMDQQLPTITIVVMSISDFFANKWKALSMGIVVVGVAFKLLSKKESVRYRLHSMVLKIPVFNTFLLNVSISRWARSLSVLLSSGVSTVYALQVSNDVLNYLPLKKKAERIIDEVKEGTSLSQAMTNAGFFFPLIVNLVSSGENSGTLDKMLLQSAHSLEIEIENSANTLLSVIEPILVLVMGGLVLTIVLAIMLPIFELNSLV